MADATKTNETTAGTVLNLDDESALEALRKNPDEFLRRTRRKLPFGFTKPRSHTDGA